MKIHVVRVISRSLHVLLIKFHVEATKVQYVLLCFFCTLSNQMAM